MGTNYYVEVRAGEVCSNPCAHCRHQAEAVRLHLGKSSGGWRFLHRAYRKVDDLNGPEGLNFPVDSRKSWLRLLDLGPITSEYGVEEDKFDLLKFIESKQVERSHSGAGHSVDYFTDDGYDFLEAEFC